MSKSIYLQCQCPEVATERGGHAWREKSFWVSRDLDACCLPAFLNRDSLAQGNEAPIKGFESAACQLLMAGVTQPGRRRRRREEEKGRDETIGLHKLIGSYNLLHICAACMRIRVCVVSMCVSFGMYRLCVCVCFRTDSLHVIITQFKLIGIDAFKCRGLTMWLGAQGAQFWQTLCSMTEYILLDLTTEFCRRLNDQWLHT